MLRSHLLCSRQQLVHCFLAVKALPGLLVFGCIPAASLASAACALSCYHLAQPDCRIVQCPQLSRLGMCDVWNMLCCENRAKKPSQHA